MLLKEFVKLPEERIIQYLRKDENEIDKRYSFLIKIIDTFDKNSNVDLKNVFEQLGYVAFQYLPIIQEKIKIILKKLKIICVIVFGILYICATIIILIITIISYRSIQIYYT